MVQVEAKVSGGRGGGEGLSGRRCIQISLHHACLYNLCALVASGVTERNETGRRSLLLVQLSEGWQWLTAAPESRLSLFTP